MIAAMSIGCYNQTVIGFPTVQTHDGSSVTPDALTELFRSNMRAVREELGLSQSELARRIGKAPGYICDMERGRRAPNLTTLAEIADGLGVTPAVLVSTAMQRKKWAVVAKVSQTTAAARSRPSVPCS